jgi:hypothetical protein
VFFPIGFAFFRVKLKFHFQLLKCSIAAKPSSSHAQTKKASIAGRLGNFVEEFYALSQFIFLTVPADWRTDSPWL